MKAAIFYPDASHWQSDVAHLGDIRKQRRIQDMRMFSSGDMSSVTDKNTSTLQQSLHVDSCTLHFHNVLVVIKQTAYEEYSQV